jgi:hypothetical protein
VPFSEEEIEELDRKLEESNTSTKEEWIGKMKRLNRVPNIVTAVWII